MTKEQQQAREMAERCAATIFKQYYIHAGEVAEIILQELNLVALLEDKARLDWLEAASLDEWDKVWASWGPLGIRPAITNAMKQEEGK